MAMLPQSNISISLVKNTLGSSSYDLKTLCTSSNINIWAKYKPVRYATNALITDDQRKSVYYGLSLPFCNTPQEVINYYNRNTTLNLLNGWGYNKPIGGTASPYRLGDFRGYNHEASRLVYSYFCINNASEDSVISSSMIFNTSTNDSIVIKDLVDWYYGIIISKADGTYLRYSATNKLTSTNNGSASVPARLLTPGTYHAYPCLTKDYYSYGVTIIPTNSVFIPLPGISKVAVQVRSASVNPTPVLNISLTGDINYNTNRSNYRVVVSNNTTNLGTLTLYCVYSDWAYPRPLVSGEYSKILGTVSSGQNPTYSGTFTNLQASGGVYLKLYKLVLVTGTGLQYECPLEPFGVEIPTDK